MTYEKQIEAFVKAVSQRILGHTIQIYCRNSQRLESYCTGVTIKLLNKLFIATSEHVFQNTDYGDLVVVHKGFPLNLEGTIHGHYANDIALFELDSNLATHLSNEYSFLEGDQIDFLHSVEYLQKYLLVGFPNTKTSVRGTKIKETPFVYHTEAVKIVNSKNEEFAINYKKRKSLKYNERSYTFVPDPIGLSGSGVWYIPRFDINPDNKECFKLVGIFKEYIPKNNIGLVSKIDIISTVE
jgi:hypothetical protein